MKRYDFIDEYEYGLREMREAIDGDFVKYEDAMEEINKLKNEIKVLKEDLKCAVRRNND